MPFGIIAVGPPGSGKSTFCHAVQQFMTAIDRKCIIVNLDFANDHLPYEASVDVAQLITVEDAMSAHGLGPNGGLVFCMEVLEKNFNWLDDQLSKHEDAYIIIDCPGQVELFTHNSALKNIIDRLVKELGYSLAAVNLVDSTHCVDPSRFISVLLLSMKTMLHLELPHINVLSKIDIIESHDELPFGIDYYTDVQDLRYLLDHMQNDHFGKKFRALNEALVDLIEEFNLVQFYTLNVEDKDSMHKLVRVIDRVNGFIFGACEVNESILETAIRVDSSLNN